VTYFKWRHILIKQSPHPKEMRGAPPPTSPKFPTIPPAGPLRLGGVRLSLKHAQSSPLRKSFYASNNTRTDTPIFI
jgi:hypothetical protein